MNVPPFLPAEPSLSGSCVNDVVSSRDRDSQSSAVDSDGVLVADLFSPGECFVDRLTVTCARDDAFFRQYAALLLRRFGLVTERSDEDTWLCRVGVDGTWKRVVQSNGRVWHDFSGSVMRKLRRAELLSQFSTA